MNEIVLISVNNLWCLERRRKINKQGWVSPCCEQSLAGGTQSEACVRVYVNLSVRFDHQKTDKKVSWAFWSLEIFRPKHLEAEETTDMIISSRFSSLSESVRRRGKVY